MVSQKQKSNNSKAAKHKGLIHTDSTGAMKIKEEDVKVQAERTFGVLRPPTGISAYFYERKFVANFGCIPSIVVLLWNRIDDLIEPIERFLGYFNRL